MKVLLPFVILFTVLVSCSEKEQTVPLRKDAKAIEVDLNTFLADKLVKVEGDSFKKVADFAPPKKYYVFYETASWCGPCKRFSPTLQTFYEVFHEMYGDQFEVIVFSYDKTEEAMLKYALESKVPLPHVSFADRDAFAQNVPILTSALPNLTVVDIHGKVLKSGFSKTGRYMGPIVPMNYLKEQLTASNTDKQ